MMQKKWFFIFGVSVVLLGFNRYAVVTAKDAHEFEDEETEAIVIDASENPDTADSHALPISRNAKQFFPYLLQSHPLLASTYLLPGIPENSVGAQPSNSAFDNTCITNQGLRGNCKSFENCFPLLNLPEDESDNVTTNYSNLQEEFYQISIDRKCSSIVHSGITEEKSPSKFSNVCCDAEPNKNENKGPTAQFFNIPAEEEALNRETSPKYSKIVNTWATCGEKQFDIKIIGGQEAVPHEFPWMVSLWGKSGKHICGGALLDNEYVLTASHCISKYTPQDVSKIKLYIGDHNIHSTSDGHHEVRSVSRIVKHKRFSLQTFLNDIALLKLDRPVAFTDRIRPICLPSGAKQIESDPQLLVAGWGQTTYKGASSSVLRKVTVPGISSDKCGTIYNGISPAGITAEMVCAGGNGVDSCIGDSGGPLIQLVNNRYEQVGIVSFGRECGTYPGVYTRIYSFLNWISVNRKKY
ncbi:Proclotting enzyme [Orchesella cincta]|uniref:Phenoloxidase-activating factor 2 n=1 Tax=Orchesella cincta TaxID=48709 RepID=A0A1D2M426_ORCCI|nr:Proclotting enzyme [Orchesella cincta]